MQNIHKFSTSCAWFWSVFVTRLWLIFDYIWEIIYWNVEISPADVSRMLKFCAAADVCSACFQKTANPVECRHLLLPHLLSWCDLSKFTFIELMEFLKLLHITEKKLDLNERYCQKSHYEHKIVWKVIGCTWFESFQIKFGMVSLTSFVLFKLLKNWIQNSLWKKYRILWTIFCIRGLEF